MNIAIFGGTFDPIHYGHLICAEEALEGFGFERILFVPSARPPHKVLGAGSASADDRYAMVCLATAENSHFEVSRVELDREGKSYAIDTVRHFKTLHDSDTEVYWILGADALLEFEIWKDWELLLEECRFVAVTRPNYDLNRLPDLLKNRVELSPITEIGVSATDIRKRVRERRSIRYRVPPVVEAYIRERGLYLSE